MVNRKSIRTRGKIQLSRCFQDLREGEHVSVSKERSIDSTFPKRLQGRTGIVGKKIGRSYEVKIQEGQREKKFIIAPIHLIKIK